MGEAGGEWCHPLANLIFNLLLKLSNHGLKPPIVVLDHEGGEEFEWGNEYKAGVKHRIVPELLRHMHKPNCLSIPTGS